MTPDHVNPEAPWPERSLLAAATAAAGRTLAPRLPIYPRYLREAERWLAPAVRGAALAASDGDGLARDEGTWFAGTSPEPPPAWQNGRRPRLAGAVSSPFARALERSERGQRAEPRRRRGAARAHAAPRSSSWPAPRTRAAPNAPATTVTYVVCRNINYTNVCYFRCGFCAFSKGRLAANLRGPAYLLGVDEVVRRCAEAWDRGATEVCLQGGIHPGFTGTWYLELVRAIRAALPDLHVHAFSPLEVWQGAATEGWELQDYLEQLRDAGLGSLPGTAAEMLDDEVRRVLCPDKLRTEQWLEVMRTAHAVGLRTTSTIMFGHIEAPIHQARHILAIRDLQRESGGFTEFVPLPFVHEEAPIALKGLATARPHLPRGRRPARGGAPGARPARDEHPGLVGEARARRRPRAARRRRERPRRHAHERVDQPRRGREPRTGVPARAHGGSHPRRGSRAAPAHDALRGRPGRADRRLVRRRTARTGRSAALRRRWAAAPRPPDPARPDQRVGNLPGSAESSGPAHGRGIARVSRFPAAGRPDEQHQETTMHLIPRRRMRRVLVLLMAMSGLLAVPALALAHSDLSLVKVVDHAQAAPGDLLTYTIVIQNHGTHANAQGTMTDTLPPHTTFVSATNGCAAAAGVITCPVAPLAVGSSISITITVRVDNDVPAGTLRNVADVTAPGDTPTTNNHGEAITTVALAGLGDFVWWDQNHDGLQGAGEPGFGGVTVHLYDSSGALVGTTTTDANGFYRFDRLRPGTTVLRLPRQPGRQRCGRPARGLRADRAERGQRRLDRLGRRAAQRRAVHRERPDGRRGLVHPDVRLRLLEAGRHR